MGLFVNTAAYNYQPIVSSAFVYYGSLTPPTLNFGFQKWFKGVQSTTYTTDPLLPSSSYTTTVRNIETAATTAAYTVPSGQLFQITGSVSGSGNVLANGFGGTYPNINGDERAGSGVGYCMLVEGPSDLRTNPLNSMPRPIAKRVRVRANVNNTPFNYIDATGSVVGFNLANSGNDYLFDIQGAWQSAFEPNTANMTKFCLDGDITGSFTAYVEGTRQYTATRIKGSNMTLNFVKRFATASMDMQNVLVSGTPYTFIAALPPAASNFTYIWSGSAII